MIRVINTATGETVGYTEQARFIKRSSAGVFIQTDEEHAQGVAYMGKPYNLRDRDGLGVEDTVMLIEFDGGEILNLAENAANSIASIEDALCEIDMGGNE
jgi:hypothetical protein